MGSDGLLNLVNRLTTLLDLPFKVVNCDEIDIQFLEIVLSKLTGFRPRPWLSVEERFTKCLKNVTKVISVPLTHINATDLKNGDATALYHLMEILIFLVEYVRNDVKDIAAISDSSENLRSTNFNSSSADLSTSGSVNSNFDQSVPRAVTPGHHSMLKEFGQSEKSFLQTDGEWIDRTNPQEHVLLQRGTSADRDTYSQYLQSNDPDGTRMAYLRVKLRECLSSSSLGHIPSLSNTVIPRKNSKDNLKRPVSNTQTVIRAASAATFRKRSVCGVVKSNDRPLVRFARNHNFQEPRTTRGKCMSDAPPDSLFDYVLEAFPKLELDSHDRRLFRRKAADLLGLHRPLSACSTTANDGAKDSDPVGHKLTWIEERQRRRLAQMIRHDLQIDRLREQRANEATDRRVRDQARERRHQLVRARNYYRQFVHEFRARKVAKIIEEEQVFRRFFEQLLAQERDNLRELQKLERDEKCRKEKLLEEELSRLEHGHRTRMGLMNDVLEREHSKRLALIRQEQAELTSRKRELRKALEANIREIQQSLLTNKDTAYFRQKDADRIIEHSRDFVF